MATFRHTKPMSPEALAAISEVLCNALYNAEQSSETRVFYTTCELFARGYTKREIETAVTNLIDCGYVSSGCREQVENAFCSLE